MKAGSGALIRQSPHVSGIGAGRGSARPAVGSGESDGEIDEAQRNDPEGDPP